MFHRVILLLPAVIGVATGCGPKIEECNELAAIANESVEAISGMKGEGTKDPAELATDAKAMTKIATQTDRKIEALTITTEGLQPKAEQYQAMMKDMAAVTTELSSLLDETVQAEDKQKAAQDAFNETQKALEGPCAEPLPSCAKVDAVLDSQPDSIGEDELLEVLAEYVAALEALELEDEPVAEVVRAHVAATKEYRAAAQEVLTLQEKLTAQYEKFDAIATREDTVVGELNAFCQAG